MKVYWLIIPLLLFVGVSTYADIYRGYRTIDCTGEYLIADSFLDLIKQEGKKTLMGMSGTLIRILNCHLLKIVKSSPAL